MVVPHAILETRVGRRFHARAATPDAGFFEDEVVIDNSVILLPTNFFNRMRPCERECREWQRRSEQSRCKAQTAHLLQAACDS